MSLEVELKLPNGKDYLSYSSASKLFQHPMTYLKYIEGKFELNEGMIFGMFYEALLYSNVDELEKFFVYDDNKVVEMAKKEYGKETKNIRATNTYKDIRDKVLSDAGSKLVITDDQVLKAEKMGCIMQDSGIFDEYLNGETQVVERKRIDTGKYIVNVLVKADVEIGDMVNDLKTTSSPISGFGYNIKKLNYDIQGYLSMEVFERDEFRFITQRTEGLFDVGVFEMTRDSHVFESGKRKFEKAVENYMGWLSPDAEFVGRNPENYVYYKKLY